MSVFLALLDRFKRLSGLFNYTCLVTDTTSFRPCVVTVSLCSEHDIVGGQ